MYTDILKISIFVLVIGGWAVSEAASEVLARRRGMRAGVKRDRGSMALSLSLGLLGVACAFLFPIVLPFATIMWKAAFWFGLLLAVLGIVLRWSARLALGRYFTGQVLIQKGHVIVQHGPYRWIRHPSYSGALLLAMGIGSMLGNWISVFIIVFGAVVGLSYRISIEERALLVEVPDYAGYMARTKRLIPFVF